MCTLLCGLNASFNLSSKSTAVTPPPLPALISNCAAGCNSPAFARSFCPSIDASWQPDAWLSNPLSVFYPSGPVYLRRTEPNVLQYALHLSVVLAYLLLVACRGIVRQSLQCLFGLDNIKLTDERFLVFRVNPMPNSEQTWHPSLHSLTQHTSIHARLSLFVSLQVAPLAARAAALVAAGGCNLRRWLLAPLAASRRWLPCAAGCLAASLGAALPLAACLGNAASLHGFRH
jgi:hypothetical protein